MAKILYTSGDIINFWYSQRIKKHWFASTPELDQEILEKYADLWLQASMGSLDDWADTAEGSLALVIILDQFPLNMFRNQAKSFTTEQQAVEVSLNALKHNFAQQIDKEKVSFLFMPLMHSEDIEHQNMSIALYMENQLESNIRFAQHHQGIIRKFGRFPHRNKILGRKSTAEEITYLASKEAFTG